MDLLAEIGIHPDGMFGHSLGENGCAYADGCFNTYEALMAAYARGKVSELIKPEKGVMAAVGKYGFIKQYVFGVILKNWIFRIKL